MNLNEYVEVYGKYKINERPLNDIDFCILSVISYLKFDDMVGKLSNAKENITLLAISKLENVKNLFRNDVFGKSNEILFYQLIKSKRFQNMEFNYYANLVNESMETQFSAITCYLESDVIVVYRGTDENMIGWVEDFHMAFSRPTMGHLLSTIYLQQVMENEKESVTVCGHSKGGNFATYATNHVDDKLQKRIKAIYNFDSPGIRIELMNTEYYEEIQKKVRKIVPQSTIIGMFLEHQEPYIAIKSTAMGFLQHNPYTWEIRNEKFIEVKKIGKRRNFFNGIFNQWILEVDEDELQIFITVLFELIEIMEISSFIELLVNRRKYVFRIGTVYNGIEKERKIVIYKMWKQYLIIFIKSLRIKKMKQEKSKEVSIDF